MRVIGMAIGLAISVGASTAGAECTCRAPGHIAHHGETICLKTPAGPRLARCEMVLNNASWTILPDACPEASLARPFELAMSPMPAASAALR